MAGIVWWEIETPNPVGFQRFHQQLWGWQFRPAFRDSDLGAAYWIIEDEGRGIGGLQQATSGHQPRAGTRVYVEVDDLEAVLIRAVELGAAVERPRTELGDDDRWFAILLDPTGISLGLWTSRPVVRPS